MDKNIFVFEYDFDMDAIWDAYRRYESEFVPYEDSRCRMEDWLVAREISFEYADTICEIFGIKAKPRFYILRANSILYPHRDSGTECSINILMSEQAAPVTYSRTNIQPQSVEGFDMDDGDKYLYKTALLNTQNVHWVQNGPADRIMLKLSIFDETYDVVAKRIESVVSNRRNG